MTLKPISVYHTHNTNAVKEIEIKEKLNKTRFIRFVEMFNESANQEKKNIPPINSIWGMEPSTQFINRDKIRQISILVILSLLLFVTILPRHVVVVSVL